MCFATLGKRLLLPIARRPFYRALTPLNASKGFLAPVVQDARSKSYQPLLVREESSVPELASKAGPAFISLCC
jgi:hypothetical protein